MAGATSTTPTEAPTPYLSRQHIRSAEPAGLPTSRRTNGATSQPHRPCHGPHVQTTDSRRTRTRGCGRSVKEIWQVSRLLTSTTKPSDGFEPKLPPAAWPVMPSRRGARTPEIPDLQLLRSPRQVAMTSSTRLPRGSETPSFERTPFRCWRRSAAPRDETAPRCKTQQEETHQQRPRIALTSPAPPTPLPRHPITAPTPVYPAEQLTVVDGVARRDLRSGSPKRIARQHGLQLRLVRAVLRCLNKPNQRTTQNGDLNETDKTGGNRHPLVGNIKTRALEAGRVPDGTVTASPFRPGPTNHLGPRPNPANETGRLGMRTTSSPSSSAAQNCSPTQAFRGCGSCTTTVPSL